MYGPVATKNIHKTRDSQHCKLFAIYANLTETDQEVKYNYLWKDCTADISVVFTPGCNYFLEKWIRKESGAPSKTIRRIPNIQSFRCQLGVRISKITLPLNLVGELSQPNYTMFFHVGTHFLGCDRFPQCLMTILTFFGLLGPTFPNRARYVNTLPTEN